MAVHEYLMHARQDDRLRAAARRRLVREVRQARADRASPAAQKAARRRLRVLWRRLPA